MSAVLPSALVGRPMTGFSNHMVTTGRSLWMRICVWERVREERGGGKGAWSGVERCGEVWGGVERD